MWDEVESGCGPNFIPITIILDFLSLRADRKSHRRCQIDYRYSQMGEPHLGAGAGAPLRDVYRPPWRLDYEQNVSSVEEAAGSVAPGAGFRVAQGTHFASSLHGKAAASGWPSPQAPGLFSFLPSSGLTPGDFLPLATVPFENGSRISCCRQRIAGLSLCPGSCGQAVSVWAKLGEALTGARRGHREIREVGPSRVSCRRRRRGRS